MKLSLKNRPLKTTHSYEYTFDNNHVKLTIAKKSTLLPVFDDRRNKQVGYLLDGPIGITADLLVHSSGGAIGEIIEETYPLTLIFPVRLPFLTVDHVKEKAPLEDLHEYEKFLAKQRYRFLDTKSNLQAKKLNVLIQAKKPKHMWFLNESSTFLIKNREFIGRKDEKKLIWFTKGEIILVNSKGRIVSTKEIFSMNKMKRLFQKYIELPLSSTFANLREIFSSF